MHWPRVPAGHFATAGDLHLSGAWWAPEQPITISNNQTVVLRGRLQGILFSLNLQPSDRSLVLRSFFPFLMIAFSTVH